MIGAFIKSLRWVDLLIYSITDPRALYRTVRDYKNEALFLGPVILFFIALAGTLASSVLFTQSGYFYYKITYGLIMTVLLYAVILLVSASLMDLYLQFSGTGSDVKGIAVVLLYSFFPMCFILPLTVIFSVLNFAPVFFYSLFWFLVFIKCSYNAVSGISEIFSLTAARAFFVFIFPFLFFGVSGFFIILLMLVCGYGYLIG